MKKLFLAIIILSSTFVIRAQAQIELTSSDARLNESVTIKPLQLINGREI